MKTPISYYGGKQKMLKHILPLIPEHKIYTESFFGGGAVFFGKEPAPSEIINDQNNMVANFYEVVKSDFHNLKKKIEATMFSRASYSVALVIYKMPHLFSKLQQAWAFYIATNNGFARRIGAWGYDRFGKCAKTFSNKKLSFDIHIVKRLENVQVECNDALKVIKSRDTESTFHYVDPPYIGTELGHYGGYTDTDYKNLLDTLSLVKGKFLLSSYPTEILKQYTEKYGWHTLSFEKSLSADKGVPGKPRKKKIEVLTANYPLKGISP